jgi:hypothetical protein
VAGPTLTQSGSALALSNLAISGDGRWVAFDSGSADIVPGDTNGADDIFVTPRKGSPPGGPQRVARPGGQDRGRRCGPLMLRTVRLPSVRLSKVKVRSAKPLQRWKTGPGKGRPPRSKSVWPSSNQ